MKKEDQSFIFHIELSTGLLGLLNFYKYVHMLTLVRRQFNKTAQEEKPCRPDQWLCLEGWWQDFISGNFNVALKIVSCCMCEPYFRWEHLCIHREKQVSHVPLSEQFLITSSERMLFTLLIVLQLFSMAGSSSFLKMMLKIILLTKELSIPSPEPPITNLLSVALYGTHYPPVSSVTYLCVSPDGMWATLDKELVLFMAVTLISVTELGTY